MAGGWQRLPPVGVTWRAAKNRCAHHVACRLPGVAARGAQLPLRMLMALKPRGAAALPCIAAASALLFRRRRAAANTAAKTRRLYSCRARRAVVPFRRHGAIKADSKRLRQHRFVRAEQPLARQLLRNARYLQRGRRLDISTTPAAVARWRCAAGFGDISDPGRQGVWKRQRWAASARLGGRRVAKRRNGGMAAWRVWRRGMKNGAGGVGGSGSLPHTHHATLHACAKQEGLPDLCTTHGTCASGG